MSLLQKITKKYTVLRHVYLLLGGVCSVLLPVGLIAFLLFYETGSPGRSELFLGRLHPVVVHLPIGILLGVFLYEMFGIPFPDMRSRPVLLFLLWIGCVTAVASAFAGFFLSITGGYDASYLFWHKWLGVSVAVASGLCFITGALEYVNRNRSNRARTYRRVNRTLLVCMVLVLSIAGHMGGVLTHGPGYVTEYLPAFVKGPLGLEATASARGKGKIKDIESAEIYGDLVKPVLQDRCVSCHGPTKTKGDLRLDTKEGIKKGGENGKVIQPGKPGDSELVRRITLPLYHEEVMPPDNKKPLSIGNTELIRWWVKTGASFEKTIGDVDEGTIPPAVRTKLDRISGPPEPDRLVIYETDVKAAEKSIVDRINSSTSWNVSYLSGKARFLEIRQQPDGPDRLERSDMEQLKPVRKQVAWLDVRNRKLTDGAWSYLEKLPTLHRLHAEGTNIQDRHLKHLSSHKYLAYLNVYGTAISDSGLDHLNFDALNRLVVWRTEVSGEKIKELRKSYPDLSIEEGLVELKPEQDDKDKSADEQTVKEYDSGIVKKMTVNVKGNFRVNADGLRNGANPYTDRGHTFSDVPGKLKGKTYIKTPNNYKNTHTGDLDGPLFSIELSSPATIYLAHDSRIDDKPEWLTKDYKKTDMTLGMKQFPKFSYRIYRRTVSAGKVTFGANFPESYDGKSTLYVVVLAKSEQREN